MKLSEFKLQRLDDFAAAMENEIKDNPFLRSPFGLGREGECVSTWEMSFRRIGLFRGTGGCNIFGKEEMIIITVHPTSSGIHPLADDGQYGWTGKINEYVAEMAVCWAFEIFSDNEIKDFLKTNKPSVSFIYSDSNGPGEITVKFNGEFWLITD